MNDEATVAVRIDQGGLASEPMPSLADIADEPGDGAWPAGWYRAEILAGFRSGKGRMFQTEDTPSKAGTSRNLTITLAITNAQGRTRNMFSSRNYRMEDLTAATVARVKAGEADKRTSITLAQLGQIEKALGQTWQKHPEGYLLTQPLVGRKVDVRLGVDKESGFNEVTAFAARGSKVK